MAATVAVPTVPPEIAISNGAVNSLPPVTVVLPISWRSTLLSNAPRELRRDRHGRAREDSEDRARDGPGVAGGAFSLRDDVSGG